MVTDDYYLRYKEPNIPFDFFAYFNIQRVTVFKFETSDEWQR